MFRPFADFLAQVIPASAAESAARIWNLLQGF
jgi:hypothetical protein